MAFGVGCSRSESSIVPILSEKKEQPQRQTKKGYWQNELDSLGISEPKQKKESNDDDDDDELENLSDIIKEAMFEDYKLAYSEEGEAHKEEAESTVTVG
jgi:hypothetical protein